MNPGSSTLVLERRFLWLTRHEQNKVASEPAEGLDSGNCRGAPHHRSDRQADDAQIGHDSVDAQASIAEKSCGSNAVVNSERSGTLTCRPLRRPASSPVK